MSANNQSPTVPPPRVCNLCKQPCARVTPSVCDRCAIAFFDALVGDYERMVAAAVAEATSMAEENAVLKQALQAAEARITEMVQLNLADLRGAHDRIRHLERDNAALQELIGVGA